MIEPKLDRDEARAADPPAANRADPALALVTSGDAGVVRALIVGDSADFSEACLAAILDRFPENESIHVAMIALPELPASITTKLIALVTGKLHNRLIARHPAPAELQGEIHKLGRDRPDWWSRHLFFSFR